MKKKIFCFDIDNTLCITKGRNYSKSKPIKKVISLINQLYSEGHCIKIFTSRFMGRNNENIKLAKKQGLALTKNQLKKWKINYHSLIMGKPSYDILIDDKMLGFRESWFNSFNINKHFSKKKK